MDISIKIKELISEGKTLDALDLFQEQLEGIDENLLNQTYLLESQYKDIQRKINLGITDGAAEINRINYALLSLCDEVKKLPEKIKKEDTPSTSTELSANPLVIFAVIAVVAIVIIILLFNYIR